MVFVKTAAAVIPFAKVFYQRLEVLWFQVTGDGLGRFTGDDDGGGGELELPVGEIKREFVTTVLRVVIIVLALPMDGGVGFRVDLDGVEFLVEISSDGLVGISFSIHLLAPAAPAGVEVDEYGFFLLL